MGYNLLPFGANFELAEISTTELSHHAPLHLGLWYMPLLVGSD